MQDQAPLPSLMQVAQDKQLVKKLLKDDQRAFKQFVDVYFPKLYRYAHHRLGNDQDVEDVVQVVLSNAARKIDTYRGEATLLTWLIRICRNEISKHFAQAHKNHDMALPFLDDDVLRAIVESIESNPGDNPDSASQRLDLIALIQFALDQLPERYATALEMKYVEGYSSMEIARHMDIGDEATQSLLARARRAFREVCSEATLNFAQFGSDNNTRGL